MILIESIDALFLAASGAAFLLVLQSLHRGYPTLKNRILLVFLLLFIFIYSACLFAEAAIINTSMDEFEDIVGALLPMWWAFVLYGLTQEIANRDLENSERKFRTIFNQTFQYTGLLDLNGNLLEINTTAMEAVGAKRSEMIGRPFWQTAWWSHSRRLQKKIKNAVGKTASGKIVRFEASHPAAAGSLLYVDFSLKPVMDRNGEITMLIAEGRDITEWKRATVEKEKLEIQLRQVHKMEAIGTLTGGIAHDFNNILSLILGYAEMAKDGEQPGANTSQELSKIIAAATRAKDLVRQMLTVSRQMKVERVPISVASMTTEVLTMLRTSMSAGIQLVYDIDPDCKPVLADSTQVRQIIIHLCTNAIHAMEESGGTMEITLQNVFWGEADNRLGTNLEPGAYVVLRVSDTGCGISPHVMDRIFDPYFTTKEPGKGTGMGLAIVHGIIGDYGGAVTVDSEEGKGTDFAVYFPAIKQAKMAAGGPDKALIFEKERILLVDDEEPVLKTGRDVLEQMGCQVTVRRTSLDALATIHNNPDVFDIVFLDQSMPGIDGADLARRIFSIRPDLPVVLCVDSPSSDHEEAAKSSGIAAVAVKPITQSAIAELMQDVRITSGEELDRLN